MIKYITTRVDTDDDSGYVEPIPNAQPSWMRLIGLGDPVLLPTQSRVSEENLAQIMDNFDLPVIVHDGAFDFSPPPWIVANRTIGLIDKLECRIGHIVEVHAYVRWCVPQADVDKITNGLAGRFVIDAKDKTTGANIGWLLVEAFPRGPIPIDAAGNLTKEQRTL